MADDVWGGYQPELRRQMLDAEAGAYIKAAELSAAFPGGIPGMKLSTETAATPTAWRMSHTVRDQIRST